MPRSRLGKDQGQSRGQGLVHHQTQGECHGQVIGQSQCKGI